MNLVWSATDPRSRRFCPTPVHSAPAELDDLFHRLRRRRIRGYVEVEIPEIESPRLAIAFRGLYAVIHKFVPARTFVLAGDGTVPDGAYVQAPVRDDLTRFTGEFVQDIDRAWDLMQTFFDTGEPDDLGEWLLLEPGPTGRQPERRSAST
jgi:hypothetical protein